MDLFRVVAGLATVFALLGIVYFFSGRARTHIVLKAIRGPAVWSRNIRTPKPLESDSVRVLKRVSLTATHQLHWIGTPQGAFLLCTHPQGCTLLPTRTARRQADREDLASHDLGRYAS
jgi:hypothetical protein